MCVCVYVCISNPRSGYLYSIINPPALECSRRVWANIAIIFLWEHLITFFRCSTKSMAKPTLEIWFTKIPIANVIPKSILAMNACAGAYYIIAACIIAIRRIPRSCPGIFMTIVCTRKTVEEAPCCAVCYLSATCEKQQNIKLRDCYNQFIT